MSKSLKRVLALLVALVMVVGLFPVAAFAETPAETNSAEPVRVFTEEDNAALHNDVFAKIEAVETDASLTRGDIATMTEADYVALIPQVIEAIESSETYVPGTLQQNGSFLVWETTVGLPCCYSPRMEAELHNTVNDPTPEEIAQAEAKAQAILDEVAETRGGHPSSPKIGLIQPYWESTSSYADPSFNSYSPSYKAMWTSLAETTGGQAIRYSMTNATVDNIADTLEQCGLVIFDSHGNTDYEGSNGDYTSQANTSYLCLTTSTGLTSADTAEVTGGFGDYHHALVYSSGAFVDGTVIANHMDQNAPNSLLYMGICLGMATDGMEAPLRAKGVEVVHGYSQSVSFVGEEIYMSKILGYVKEGKCYGDAITTAKNETCWWDPHPSYTSYTESEAVSNKIAFPIVVSSEDSYPGHGNVDAIQDVFSAWNLLGDPMVVTAVSNNTSWGTVSVNGYTITATPSEGYYAESYTVTEGTATVTQNGNVFSVRPETDCTVQINFAAKTPATVTYVAGDTEIGTVATYVGDDVTLPTSSTEFNEWKFVGWMDQGLATTMEKPSYYKPGTTYTVTEADTTIYALYTHVEGNGNTGYELVTETPDDWAGTYVISSAKDTGMKVMTGVEGNVKIETERNGFTAFADTGMELDETLLTEVDDAYLFDAEDVGNGSYSLCSRSAGSYLAIESSYLWVKADYTANICAWTLTASDNGTTLKCTNQSSYPYLSWSSGNYWAAASGSSSFVQLWKQTACGDVYYSTAPVVEAHNHEMTYFAAEAPTCGSEGHTAYYRCSVCFKYFSDEAGEHEITAASTVIPATGDHTWGEWISNNNGKHTRTCTVCEAKETENCSYTADVTAPTVTEQGYTTYTCYICGYSYDDDYVSPLGVDYTVTFVVPLECEQPNDMVSNTNTGINLPSLVAPDGYTFLGWVEQVYDNVDVRPAQILSGHYVAQQNVTLYALFKYVVNDGTGETVYELVTETLDDWTGTYVISSAKDTGMSVMTGVAGSVNIESGSTGYTAFADTDISLDDNILNGVADAYLFEVENVGDNAYSICSKSEGSFLAVYNAFIQVRANYESDYCAWTLTASNDGAVLRCTADTSYPYLSWNSKWYANSSEAKIQLWKSNAGGTTYWTTVIGEPDPGVDYTLTFVTPAGVTAPEAMTANSVTGAVLPTVEAPEGYKFLGWVLDDYDNVVVKPETILSGRYRPQSDLTLNALFRYFTEDGGVCYRLVTEEQDDWTGNYVITCNKDEATMIVMHGAPADVTYESSDSYGMYELADSGMTLADNVLCDAGENYVFAVEPRDEGYSIQNLGSENFVGRYVTTEDNSAQLFSFSEYDATYCRWTFAYGDAGDSDSVNNVLIHNVVDPNLGQYYQYLGCGWYYHFATAQNNYPYFWVDGPGDTYDSDIYYMHLWKETNGTPAYTTVFNEVVPELPVITADPESVTAGMGKYVTFTVEAEGEELGYQWQFKKANSDTWKDWEGKISATLRFKAASTNNGCQYRCVVTNAAGSVTSEAATLTVISAPVITADPESVTVAQGKYATFTVEAEGEELSYQWQFKKPTSNTWKNWEGKTEATLRFKGNESNDEYQYRCVVTNLGGKVTSEAATLNVVTAPSITTNPVSASILQGELATFTVEAEGEELTYQWQFKKPTSNTWKNWEGKTEATLQFKGTNYNDDYQYRCVVTNVAGKVVSEAATLTVTGKLFITANPESVTVMRGELVSFEVEAEGEELSYQWQFKKPGSNSWKNWEGKTEATLQFKATSYNDGYQYRCVVTNEHAIVHSKPATLTVTAPVA